MPWHITVLVSFTEDVLDVRSRNINLWYYVSEHQGHLWYFLLQLFFPQKSIPFIPSVFRQPMRATNSRETNIPLFQEERPTPSHWNPSTCDLLDRLLTLAPNARVSSLKELKQTSVMRELDFDRVLNKQIKPPFTPPKDHLNCDPTFELEEMIIETKPLHKKKKRLAKQRSVAFVRIFP